MTVWRNAETDPPKKAGQYLVRSGTRVDLAWYQWREDEKLHWGETPHPFPEEWCEVPA